MLSFSDQMLLRVGTHAIWDTRGMAATLDPDRDG